MAIEATPKGSRLHIGLFGRRNAGKSSLLNVFVKQSASIVSPVPGTTTDPVEKTMELQPLGPVVFIDTAGLDDDGDLGALRVNRTHQVIERVDLAILVTEASAWGEFEESLLVEAQGRGLPVVIALNKTDLCPASAGLRHELDKKRRAWVEISVLTGTGVPELREAVIAAAQVVLDAAVPIVADLVSGGDLALLVVPIDKEAPKGRLILPQAQTIRELLDHDALCMVVKERELRSALARLSKPPKIVITDSQAFLKVAADTPLGTLMTSFSILFSRAKGDLTTQVAGALAADRLKPGAQVLVAEACTHHPIGEDIGRVKIPRWLTQYVGGALQFEHVQGHDFPDDPSAFDLVVHCGACMWNRQSMQARIRRCQAAGVPITNYGLIIAYSLGILERALSPFPTALEFYRSRAREGTAV